MFSPCQQHACLLACYGAQDEAQKCGETRSCFTRRHDSFAQTNLASKQNWRMITMKLLGLNQSKNPAVEVFFRTWMRNRNGRKWFSRCCYFANILNHEFRDLHWCTRKCNQVEDWASAPEGYAFLASDQVSCTPALRHARSQPCLFSLLHNCASPSTLEAHPSIKLAMLFVHSKCKRTMNVLRFSFWSPELNQYVYTNYLLSIWSALMRGNMKRSFIMAYHRLHCVQVV